MGDVPALAWQLVVTLVPLALGLGALATVVFDKETVREFAVRRGETSRPSSLLDSLTSSSRRASGP